MFSERRLEGADAMSTSRRKQRREQKKESAQIARKPEEAKPDVASSQTIPSEPCQKCCKCEPPKNPWWYRWTDPIAAFTFLLVIVTGIQVWVFIVSERA